MSRSLGGKGEKRTHGDASANSPDELSPSPTVIARYTRCEEDELVDLIGIVCRMQFKALTQSAQYAAPDHNKTRRARITFCPYSREPMLLFIVL